ncbi:MAG: hypothetical protein EGP10_01775 [SAR202 cluster bacterium]|nr:MAG: hypothetical protein EGP10_01775 [SAR202 cluster bacterium]|tara:strand:- start:64 stop:402 length:339 start_codon:yes stop_codon:yes gene_type:complete
MSAISDKRYHIMARNNSNQPTRQLFAKIDESLYLAIKAKSAQERLSIREILETALYQFLNVPNSIPNASTQSKQSIWEQDEYLLMQTERPVGSPISLSDSEKKKIAKEGFFE